MAWMRLICVLGLAATTAGFLASCSDESASSTTSLGASESGCVDTGELAVAPIDQSDGRTTELIEGTSGDFVAGNFALLDNQFRTPAGKPVAKLYWIPRSGDTAKTELLTVVVEAPDGGGQKSVQQFGDDVDWSRTAGGRYFWPSEVVFPDPGVWHLRVSSPELDEGCFEVVVA